MFQVAVFDIYLSQNREIESSMCIVLVVFEIATLLQRLLYYWINYLQTKYSILYYPLILVLPDRDNEFENR